ncbi:unnamed protein product [Parnassius apollo]|uniref:(apollo) hypothetical protein n=1 Tax=Parnassius apollo TaxID=110799 RepID=A0A8S3WNB7_PARAO|nr:unnamed protein product [Parnassius apollo]
MQDPQANMFKKAGFDDTIFLSDEDFKNINGDINLSLADMGVMENFLQNEDTLEAASKFQPQFELFIPVSPSGPPESKSFPGTLNFVVEIKGTETDKKKYLYSARLNRIYVNMGVNFPVHFSWDAAKQVLLYPTGLYVRATVVFSDQSQAEKRVERCLQHIHEPNNPGSETIVKHVLRSARDLGTDGLYYCGQPDRPDSWLSVLLHLSAPAGHAYQFVCKNSCSSGINRRNIAIIFTLEDSHGTILGRQSVGVRSCSCPKRDLSRDEKEEGKGKRKMKQPQSETHKKLKIEVLENDEEIVTLPKIPIKGIKTVMTGLEVMQRMMELSASEAAKRKDQKEVDEYKSCLTSLGTTIDNIKKGLKPPSMQ